MELCPVQWPSPHTAVAILPDQIDITSTSQIQAALNQALTDGATVLIADMSATSFCGSDGIRTLLTASTTAHQAGAQLRIAAPGPHIRHVLDLTGATSLLDLYPDLPAALTGPPS